MASEDIAELVRRCLAGEQSAIAELVVRFERPVLGLCLRMVRNRQDAEDLTQESFVRAIRNLHRWDSTREFRPWLFAIAGNRCRSLLALRSRRPPPAHLIEEAAPECEARPDHRPLLEEVKQALSTLREEYRQAFELFHEQELSYAEIAAILDCPVGTVKTWIHRTRAELARLLRERYEEEMSNVVR